jgi:hypothetical protein
MVKEQEYEGKVKGFTSRAEKPWWSNDTITEWTFSLIRFNDELGKPLPPIPVEMRGKSFDGFINEEDTVVVKGNWEIGRMLETTKLYNKTNNIWVEAHKYH